MNIFGIWSIFTIRCNSVSEPNQLNKPYLPNVPYLPNNLNQPYLPNKLNQSYLPNELYLLTSLNFNYATIQIYNNLSQLLKISKVWFGLVQFGMVWYGLVWFVTKSIQSQYESFIKIKLVLAVLEKIYSWFCLIKFGFVFGFGLVW